MYEKIFNHKSHILKEQFIFTNLRENLDVNSMLQTYHNELNKTFTAETRQESRIVSATSPRPIFCTKT